MKKIVLLISIVLILLLKSSLILAQGVSLSVQIAPPDLLTYSQPPCPGDGYLWQPGYWAYGDDGYGSQDYYWVPGVWVLPPTPGYYWTPNYWEFYGGYYRWHHGYWGPQVGYYGGVNYGYGYWGDGFGGGRWEGNRFHYNTAVMNVNTTIVHNTYNDRSVVRANNNRTSFNGPGGNGAGRPASRDHFTEHTPPTLEQNSHHNAASTDRRQFANVNHQRPATSAMSSPGGTHFDQQGHEFKKPEQHHDSEFQHNTPPQQNNPQPQHVNPQPQHINAPRSQPMQVRPSPRQAPSGGRPRK